ncbi:hypothetical protein [Micromonospora aurantiaca (nom. illeg.)]|uniref:hypothetical protein n=1 Tax=Micromonospora aurantiaca (nom. illeg.) TaxID=47850 RepID=UPI0037881108
MSRTRSATEPTPPSRRRWVRWTLAVLLLASAGCGRGFGEESGDALARDTAAAEAKQLNTELGHRNRARDAGSIAAAEIVQEPTDAASGGGATVRREALAWSGRTAGNERATVDVRFVVTVPEQPPVSIGGASNSAGEATRCYRYEFELYRYTTYHEIDCPSGPAPSPPTAAPVPRVPEDGRQRLTAVLRTATPDTLAGAVRAAFPQDWISVDTTVHEGALVAAVGVPAERDCLLLVRTPAGKIESPGYDRIWLEPGETGCRTALYVAPPR